MAVVLETTLGDITIDLYMEQRPKACLNFLKLCRIKYYNFNLFHTVNHGFIAQTGDPTGGRDGGESIWGVMEGPAKRYFEAESTPRIKHTRTGLISFVGDKDSMIGSQFFITLADDLTYLDAQHCVFGEVADGFDILRLLNEAICDTDHRPYQDIRITHTVVLEDPFPDPEKLIVPDASPEPTAERLKGGRIAPDEDIDETAGKSAKEVLEGIAEKEAKARATILEMIGDIPDAEMAPPENVLFVCKLNPVTNDDDLEIIFSRFGKIKSCEVIRDKKTGDSLQYAFVEFMEQKSCEDAYFKMDNVLIDDRRIHVDFSQSVAKIKWHGKGRGVTHFNDRGERENDDPKNDIGKGHYRFIKRDNREEKPEDKKSRSRSRSRSSSRSKSKSRSRDRQNGNRYRRNYESKRFEEYKDRFNDRPYYNNYRQMNYNNYNRGFNNRRYQRQNDRRQQNYSRDRRNDYVDYRRFDQYNRRRDVDRTRKSRSRSRDNNRSRTMRYKKENDEKPKKVEKKKYSSDESSSVEEVVTKKPKKSKKKKSKKKKHSDQSDSDSDEHKKSKKKKKKSKKRRSTTSSSDSESDSEDEPSPKKKSKKH